MVIVESKILTVILVLILLVISYSMGCTDDEKKPEVFPDLKSPIAVIEASATRIIENETIVFNSSKSSDPDGKITTYIWDFGDGYKNTTNSTNVSHRYETLNLDGEPYNVTLTVIDDHSQDNKTSINITVIPMRYTADSATWLLSRDIPGTQHQLNVSFEKQPFDANFTLNLSLLGGAFDLDINIKANLSVAITDPENQEIYSNEYDITGSGSDNIYLPVDDFSKAGTYSITMDCKKGAVRVTYVLTINYL